MKQSGLIALVLAVLLPGVGSGQSSLQNMEPYPVAEQGFSRQVFRVPPAENEPDRKVEILVGKVMEIDCNTTSFGGILERQIADGWGFPYYVLRKVGGPISTRMACPPGEKKREVFVTVRGEGFLQRYNSKLPIVTYVPDGFEVRYRIWSASEELGRAVVE